MADRKPTLWDDVKLVPRVDLGDNEYAEVLSVDLSGVTIEAAAGLTDEELRATPVDVNVTNAADFPGGSSSGGGLTDTELRASAVPIDISAQAYAPLGVELAGPVSTKTELSPGSPDQATVGATSGTVVSQNTTRRGLVLTNTSSNVISLGFDFDAVLNTGVTLNPGGVFVMDEYTFNIYEVNAIASSAGSNLAIQEFNA